MENMIISRRELEKMTSDEKAKLVKLRIPVTSDVYILLEQGEKNCVPRRKIVEEYGTGPDIVYYANGIVKTPNYELCSLHAISASPVPTK